MKRGMRGATLLLVLTLIPMSAQAGLLTFDGAAAIVGSKPARDGIGDVYSAALGISAELDVTVKTLYRVALTLSPTYGLGTPDAGPLAADPSGSLWAVPVLATLQIPVMPSAPYVPYVGLGGGIHYVRESISFQSGIGERSRTKTESAPGWHVMAGVEQHKSARLFAELWFTKAVGGGVDDAIDGRNLGGLEIRLGYRRTF